MRQIAAEVREEYTVEQADALAGGSPRAGSRHPAGGPGAGDRRVQPALQPARDQPAARRAQPAVRAGRHGTGGGVAARRLPGAGRPGARRGRRDGLRRRRPGGALDLLRDVADAVEAYGALVGSEVAGPGPDDQRLREALAAPGPTGTGWPGCCATRSGCARDEWQLHGQLTSHIDQLLRDVDSEARAELRRSWPTPTARGTGPEPAGPDGPRADPASAAPDRLARRRARRSTGRRPGRAGRSAVVGARPATAETSARFMPQTSSVWSRRQRVEGAVGQRHRAGRRARGS